VAIFLSSVILGPSSVVGSTNPSFYSLGFGSIISLATPARASYSAAIASSLVARRSDCFAAISQQELNQSSFGKVFEPIHALVLQEHADEKGPLSYLCA
jgi:hypothetical protein